MIVREGEAFAVRGNSLLHWTPAGYDRRHCAPARHRRSTC